MADRWAAAAMMAGHPNDADTWNLRNVAFTIHVGANDSGHNRNKMARHWGQNLAGNHEDDPEGYNNWTVLHGGKGHWMDGQDRAAVPWMARHRRNPIPNRIVWKQYNSTRNRFYWLAVNNPRPRTHVSVRRQGQKIDILVYNDPIPQLLIRFNDQMLNLDEPVEVTTGPNRPHFTGGKLVYKGRVQRTIALIAKTLAERGDRTAVFSGELAVNASGQ